MKTITKIIILNAFWYVAVYFGPQSNRLEQLIFLVSILMVIANYFIYRVKMPPKKYFMMLIYFLTYGYIQDFALSFFGLVQYQSIYPPYWLLSMYAVFLCYYDDIFLKFRNFSEEVKILMGAIGGPIAYLSGASIADLTIPPDSKFWYIIFIAISWGLFFPASLLAYKKMEQADGDA